MKDQDNGLRLDANVLSSPLYVAGTHIETVKEQYGLKDVVKLASNENPLGPSPKAVAAIRKTLSNLSRYPPGDALELRQRLAVKLGRGLADDSFVTGNGASEILAMLAQGLLERGDESIICRPTFPLYDIFSRRRGATPVWADLGADFCYDVERMLAAVSDRTRMMFVCCPNNPTGTTIAPAEADWLVDQAPPDVVLVFDESYRVFATDVELPDTLGYVQSGRNVIVVRSFSKIHGLAGLRIGYAIARPKVARYLRRLQQPFHHSRLVLHGALAALDDDEHVRRTRELVAAERDWLQARLDRLGLFCIPSQANFIAIEAGYPADLVYERMLRQGVIIRPLSFFYMPDFIRVTVGARADNERFLDALEKTLRELSKLPSEALLAAEQSASKVMV